MGRDTKGRWAPGTSGNPSGGVKGTLSFTSALKRAMADPPTAVHRCRAAEMAGVEVSLVPEFGRLLDLYAWAAIVGGLSSIERLREVLDRIDPKPNRLQVETGPLRRPVRPGVPEDSEAAAAEDYYGSLEADMREHEDPLH